MTTRERAMVLVGLTAGAALAGVVYWLWLILRNGDESGIRVKNGSLFLKTVSANGWQTAGTEFETRGRGKACFTVLVVNPGGTCTMSSLERVRSVRFGHIGGGSGGGHEVGLLGGRFRARLSDSWRIDPSDPTRLESTNPQFRLQSVEARAGNQTLRCTFVGHADDTVAIDAADVC